MACENLDHPVWTDKTGKCWRLHDMEIGHLRNARRHVSRTLAIYYRGPYPSGEHAQDAFEGELAAFEGMEESMLAELERRGEHTSPGQILLDLVSGLKRGHDG